MFLTLTCQPSTPQHHFPCLWNTWILSRRLSLGTLLLIPMPHPRQPATQWQMSVFRKKHSLCMRLITTEYTRVLTFCGEETHARVCVHKSKCGKAITKILAMTNSRERDGWVISFLCLYLCSLAVCNFGPRPFLSILISGQDGGGVGEHFSGGATSMALKQRFSNFAVHHFLGVWGQCRSWGPVRWLWFSVSKVQLLESAF